MLESRLFEHVLSLSLLPPHPHPPPLSFMQLFSDPTHVLRNYLNEQELINIRVSGGENSTDSGFYKVHPKIKEYKHGVAQPGVLCVKPDKTVLYAWAINPSFVSGRLSVQWWRLMSRITTRIIV